MDKKVKSRWIKALRSGRYKQTPCVLQDFRGKNCCLGVLCRVMRLKKIKDGRQTYFIDNDEKVVSILPKTFRKKIGISSGEQQILTCLNDEKNASFKEIANWIKKNL